MNEFIEECRREWKRLGVADHHANEMAADLTADLEEAEAEGTSAEEVLGSGAFDPRTFAATWANERGLVKRGPANERGLPHRSRIAAAIGIFTVIAVIGAAIAVLASPSEPEKLTLRSPVAPPQGAIWVSVDPEEPFPPESLPRPRVARIITAGRPGLGAQTLTVDVNDSGLGMEDVGWVLLIVGLVGVLPLATLWLLGGVPSAPRPSV